jgi:hypothetical protein
MRQKPRPMSAAILCVVFLVMVAVLSGCVSSAASLHSWGDGRWGWADFDDRCSENCGI